MSDESEETFTEAPSLSGKLYIVALPIGEASDISERAKQTLASVDIVAAEDTRVFKKLATKAGIKVKRVLSHHNFNEGNSSKELIELLKAHQSVALVCDAGTPGISDPGYRLLSDAYSEKIPVVVVPGPSSLTAVLSICPIGGASHFFGAFVPSRQKERLEYFEKVKGKSDRIIVFESPHRLREHLEDALKCLGDVQLFVARELTKPFQETFFGPISKVQQHFRVHEPRGEFVLIYENPAQQNLDQKTVEDQIRAFLQLGQSHSDILENLKGETDLSRKELYNLIEQLKKQS